MAANPRAMPAMPAEAIHAPMLMLQANRIAYEAAAKSANLLKMSKRGCVRG